MRVHHDFHGSRGETDRQRDDRRVSRSGRNRVRDEKKAKREREGALSFEPTAAHYPHYSSTLLLLRSWDPLGPCSTGIQIETSDRTSRGSVWGGRARGFSSRWRAVPRASWRPRVPATDRVARSSRGEPCSRASLGDRPSGSLNQTSFYPPVPD